MLLYLDEEYELVENMPANKLSEVQWETSSYYGNAEIEYTFRTPLHIGEWNLCSITITRGWNNSSISKIMAHRNQMTIINLIEAIRFSRFIKEEQWFNKGNTELGLNSRILRKVISFLETIPTALKTKEGIKLYFIGLSSRNMNELSEFYKDFLNSRKNLSESDTRYLEDFFANKMHSLLSN